MFAFLSPQQRIHADPLQSRKTASAWFGHLSASDVLTRQQKVVDAFDAMRRSLTEVDRHRLGAIAYIDQSFEPEHRRLVQWYLEHLETSPPLAARFRHAASEVNLAFLQTYQNALDAVCARAGEARWKPLVPMVLIRLVRCLGVDAKLKIMNHEQWIPARWNDLHQTFLRAIELDVERMPMPLDAQPFAQKQTVEHEYILALLIHRLDTGNLSPAEIEWASNGLRDWSTGLTVDAKARNRGGFYVDLSGSTGLVRRTGNDRGVQLGYLDTTMLTTRLDNVAQLLRGRDPAANGIGAMSPQQQLATIEKLRPAISPIRDNELRRHVRHTVDIAAAVHAGFDAIASYLAARAGAKVNSQDTRRRTARDWQHALRYDVRDTNMLPSHLRSDDWIDATPFMHDDARSDLGVQLADHSVAAIEHIEIPAPGEASLSANGTHEPAARSAAPASSAEFDWRLTDRSVDGARLFAPASANDNVALRSLLAITQIGSDDCMLAMVRRLHKQGNQVELGVSLIADRAIAANLHGMRPSNKEMSVVVDGIDVSQYGPRFVGLYLLPPPGAQTRASIRTVIVPTLQYAQGRRLMLATGRSSYTIVLRNVIDRDADWTWATITIANKTPRQN